MRRREPVLRISAAGLGSGFGAVAVGSIASTSALAGLASSPVRPRCRVLLLYLNRRALFGRICAGVEGAIPRVELPQDQRFVVPSERPRPISLTVLRVSYSERRCSGACEIDGGGDQG